MNTLLTGVIVALAVVNAQAWNPPCNPDPHQQGTGCFAALGPCDGTFRTQWHRTPPPNLTSLTLVSDPAACLNVEAWGVDIGNHIWITSCHPEEKAHMLNREWVLQDNGTIVNPTSGHCLDAVHGQDGTSGDLIKLSPCDKTDKFTPNQWSFNDKDNTYRTAKGLCLYIPENDNPPPPPPPPAPPSPPPYTASATINVSSSEPSAHSAASYVSFNFDWHKDDEEVPVWINMSVQKIDFASPSLNTALGLMSPAKLRIGGSEGDRIIYNVDDKGCDYWNSNQPDIPVDPAFCLNMSRWSALVDLCSKHGILLVFGLNAMTRANNSAPANLTNHEAFLQHIASNNQAVYGFEYGNELPKVDPTVMANDYLRLRKLINKYWPSASNRPKLIGNDLNTNPDYLKPFLKIVGDNIDVVTYHNYVGYGLDPNLVNEIPTLKFLNEGWSHASGVEAVQVSEAPHAEIWVGEIAAAWHSGRENVTNAFVSSLWYADALGTLAAHNHTGFCRQTLLGGSYGLLRRDNYMPNPDFYTAWLFHDLMGDAVFRTVADGKGSSGQGGDTIRAYTHCNRQGKGLSMLIINIDRSATFKASVGGVDDLGGSRNDYLLTASSPTSRHLELNGKPWTDFSKPSPQSVSSDVTVITMPPFSLGYFVFPDAKVDACN